MVEKRLVEGSESEYEDVIVTEAKEATQVEVLEKIVEFNISTPYVIDERGYVSIYNAIYSKYGGVHINKPLATAAIKHLQATTTL